MELRPFDGEYAATVADWAVTAHEVSLLCERDEFPFPAELLTSWPKVADDIKSFLFLDGETPVGYGELWLDDEEDEVELARIIVAAQLRRTGLWRVLVRELVSQAVAAGYRDVFMRVHPDNDAALGSYRAAGFVPVAPELTAAWNEPQPFDYVWLQYDPSNRNCFMH